MSLFPLKGINILSTTTLPLFSAILCVCRQSARSIHPLMVQLVRLRTPYSHSTIYPLLFLNSDDPSFSTLAGICCVACSSGPSSTDIHSSSSISNTSETDLDSSTLSGHPDTLTRSATLPMTLL